MCALIGILACQEPITVQPNLLRNPYVELIRGISPPVSYGDFLNVWWGNLPGVSNSLIGAIVFGVLAAIDLVLLSGARLPRWMRWGLSTGSLGGIVFITQFLSISIMTFGKPYLFCMVIWPIIIPVAVHSQAWAAADGHLGLCDNLALGVFRARWWATAAIYLTAVLTIVIALGGQLARLFK